MTHWETDDDFEGDEFDGDESDELDDEPTIPCPHCGAEIHEEAQRCPHCERYISEEDAPAARKPWWVVLGAILGLYAAYRWVVG